MRGTLTEICGDRVTINTYTAPEVGWRANSHLVELPDEILLVDVPLTVDDTRELLDIAGHFGKPISRLYVSHAHPDHFAGASLVDAPTYALAGVAKRIIENGDFQIRGSYQLTPGHDGAEPPKARHIDVVAEPGEEIIDGVRFELDSVVGGDSSPQMVIGLPDESILIAQDVLYNRVHAFLGEQNFDAWLDTIDALAEQPYKTILPGHGLPGGHLLFAMTRSYLTAARAAYKAASGPDDLSRRLREAYPDYGGTALHPLQNFFLYPTKKVTH